MVMEKPVGVRKNEGEEGKDRTDALVDVKVSKTSHYCLPLLSSATLMVMLTCAAAAQVLMASGSA